MRTALGPIIRLAVCLAPLLMVMPGIAAQGVDVLPQQADSMEHRGILLQEGGLEVFRASAADATSAPAIAISASSFHALLFQKNQASVSNQKVNYGLGTEPEPIGTEDSPLRNATLRVLGGQPAIDVRVVSTGDGASLQGQLRGRTTLTALADAQLESSGEIGRLEPGSQNSYTDERQGAFLSRTMDHPVALSQTHGPTTHGVVRGDFIVEVLGIDLLLEAEGADGRVLHSGVDRHTFSGQQTATETVWFLRMFIQDGTLEFRSTHTTVQWAMRAINVTGDSGPLMLQGTQGPQDVRFPSGYVGTLTPNEHSRLRLTLRESSNPMMPTAAFWAPPTGFNPVPIAAALLAVALVTLTVRTLRTAPPLAHMESALEAGAFSRAARLAGRILRTDPKRESAHLGRAIALSRSGRPERVVRDLEPFLQGNEPTDGTLHYVLGLAYQDLGKEKDAARALSEAVRRTPALAQQIAEPPEPHRQAGPEGDAQGYT